jgi:hypothetical protein
MEESRIDLDLRPGRELGLTVSPGYVPLRRADVLQLDMGDRLILYHRDLGLVHHLNASAAILWRGCDGSTSTIDLAREIAADHGLDPSEVEPQVASVIAEFDALGLVNDATAAIEEPA